MGGATSRFGETDWETADGGWKADNGATNTLDGKPPTTDHTILILKKPNVVNQREFVVVDADDGPEPLYTSKPIQGTMKNFDLLDKDGNKLFCVQTDSARETWNIYSYKQVWDGQAVSYEAAIGSKQDVSDAPLFCKARIDITWNKHHGQVMLYEKSADDTTNPKGVVDETKPILKVEEIASKTGQYQSFIPTHYDTSADTNPSPTSRASAVIMNSASDLVDTIVPSMHPSLIGWWVWEHTAKRNELRMHLAKNTDIALHCLVAIVANMITVETRGASE